MNRRDFFEKSGVLLSVGALLKSLDIFNGINISAMAASPVLSMFPPNNERVLVVIQLLGGNDGLNTVIPLDAYDNLAKLRKNILIPSAKILKATDTLGFHPSLNGIAELFANNELCVVQNVGYPNQNRSHFRSFDIWNSASPSDEFWTTGWLGRYLEKFHSSYPDNYPNKTFPHPLAINIGNAVSETCQGSSNNFGFAVNHPEELFVLPETDFIEEIIPSGYEKELRFIQTNIKQTNAYAKIVLKALEKGNNKINYPQNNTLAQQLKVVSKLISGGLQTKIYVLTLGGFDTHANQTDKEDSCLGDHADKLKTLSDAIKAFQDDLKLLNLEKRVLGMTTSEFGRQVMSNDSNGTDHGDASPLFVFGASIKNVMIGTNPIIADRVEPQTAVNMEIDFRNVFGTVLKDWMGLSTDDIKLLFQMDYNPISIFYK